MGEREIPLLQKRHRHSKNMSKEPINYSFEKRRIYETKSSPCLDYAYGNFEAFVFFQYVNYTVGKSEVQIFSDLPPSLSKYPPNFDL